MARATLLAYEERRELSLTDAGAELRINNEGAERFAGHAAVFDTRAAIGNPLRWGFYEEVAPGAFTKTLDEGDARFLLDHNPHYVVARASSGTLSLAQDKQGLAVDSALDTELSYVRDLKANLRNGNITGMSFGFRVVKDDWSKESVTTSDGNNAEVEVRRLLEVQLLEVSAVTFPAYSSTDAGLRHSLVPALLHRNDPDALVRAAVARPDLALELLGHEIGGEPVERAGDPKKPYGNVTYADPGYQSDKKKRYPIDTKEHVMAAWSYINQAKNAAKYTSSQLAAIKAKIKAAMKKFGMTPSHASLTLDELLEVMVVDRGVGSCTEEPGETTPPPPDDDDEPADATRIAPSASEMAAVRLRVLQTQLRRPA